MRTNRTKLLLAFFAAIAAISAVLLVFMKPAKNTNVPHGLRTRFSVPHAFVLNRGQLPRNVIFASNWTLSQIDKPVSRIILEKGGMEFPLPGRDISRTARLSFGSDNIKNPVGEQSLPGYSNYFIGNDPSRWITGVPQYGEVRYKDVYPATDLVFRPVREGVEFDIVLKKGAHPEKITLSIANAGFRMGRDGSLVIGGAAGLVLKKPAIYKEVAGEGKIPVEGGFELKDKYHAGFRLARQDTDEKTVIDPVLVFSTYFGGSLTDQAQAAATDSSGNFYMAGFTRSPNFPITNAVQPSWNGGANFGDAFVAKFSPSGKHVYSTFLGGSADDAAFGIAADASGNAYVTGLTQSSNFPTTLNTFQPKLAGSQNAFVTKLAPDGKSLVYSTFAGGSVSDQGAAIFVNSSGSAYVTGSTTSTNFPHTANAAQSILNGASNGFYFKLAPAGNSLQYSTFLGGSSSDKCAGIAVDAAGNAYVTGTTTSTNFPVLNARQTSLTGSSNAFLTKFSPAGQIVFSTYHGGSAADSGSAVALDPSGNPYITGTTNSSNFPALSNFQSFQGGNDAFVSKFNTTGGLVYSTFLGGSSDDFGQSLTVSPADEAIVAGWTISTNFPLQNPIQSSAAGENAFVTKLNPEGSGLVFSTLIGGSADDQAFAVALDPTQNIFAAGRTNSTDFPVINAAQPGFAGSFDAFATEISASLNAPPSVPILNSPANGATGLPTSVTFSWQRSSEPEGEAVVYDLFVCTDSSFSNCVPTQTASLDKPKENYAMRFAGVITLFTMGMVFFKKGRAGLASVIVALAIFSSAVSCGGHHGGGTSSPGIAQVTISGLAHSTTYFWKVIAIDSAGASSESEVRDFTTG